VAAPALEIRRFTGPAEEWDAFISADAGGTAAHLFGWKRVVEDVYQHECPYLAAWAPSRLTGVLPLVDVHSIAFGRYLVSMPYMSAGGPIGSATTQLAEDALRLAREKRAKMLELRCTAAHDLPMSAWTGKVTSVLALESSTESTWERLPSKLRSQIRRPGKSGVETRFGDDQLNPFFTVFARNMRDLGSPTHPKHFFQAVLRELGAHVWFGCAYYRGAPIAAGCAVHWRDEVEMLWASALREHSSLAANMLLYWAFIERSVAAGATRFNFGRSTPDTGAHRFKLQWGARDEPLYWYRSALRAGADAPNRAEGSMSFATRLWQHVPVPLATFLGSRLRGGIPA